jgi:hypothetical protein
MLNETHLAMSGTRTQNFNDSPALIAQDISIALIFLYEVGEKFNHKLNIYKYYNYFNISRIIAEYI